VGLGPDPLVIRYGGREDQLSSKIIGLDLYRIYSLLKILNMPFLDEDKKALIEKTLKQKAKTYIAGCLKRGKVEEAQRIKELINSHS
jgi:hypothetical protein